MRRTLRRVGPQMAAAADYVRRNPGCAILPVGEYLGFTRNRGYGYDPVHRAIHAGLIVSRGGKGNSYALYPAEHARELDAITTFARACHVAWRSIPLTDDSPDSEDTRRGDYMRDSAKYDY